MTFFFAKKKLMRFCSPPGHAPSSNQRSLKRPVAPNSTTCLELERECGRSESSALEHVELRISFWPPFEVTCHQPRQSPVLDCSLSVEACRVHPAVDRSYTNLTFPFPGAITVHLGVSAPYFQPPPD